MNVLVSVLSIGQVKQRMRDIRIDAVHHGSVIHFGRQGRDEMVIVSASLWESLNSFNKGEVPAANLPRGPYDAFDRALRTGRLAPAGARARRRMPLEAGSPLTTEQMIVLGTERP